LFEVECDYDPDEKIGEKTVKNRDVE
jgi:hypothetical protein